MRAPLLALALIPALAAGSAAAETVLVVGDSHTAGAFGIALDDALRADTSNRVATYGVCSARPQSYLSETPHGCGWLFRGFDKKAPAKWLGGRVYKVTVKDGKGGTKEVEMVRTPELAQLISDHTPTAVVVALGSNVPTSHASIKATLDAIHKAGAACFWVGPPDMRSPSSAQIDTVYADLRKDGIGEFVTIANARKDACRLIDSRGLGYLKYPADGGDGTHYGGKLAPLASRWGADAAAAVLQALAAP